MGGTDGAERGSEEERPAPTTGPRRRAREPAPRRAPPAVSMQPTCGPGASSGRSDRAGGGATDGEAEYGSMPLRIMWTAALWTQPHADMRLEKATSRAYGSTAAQCRDGFRVWQYANAEPEPDCGQAMRPQARGMRTEPHPEIKLEKASGLCGGWRAQRSGASPGVFLLFS